MTLEDEGYGAWYALAVLGAVLAVIIILGVIWGS